MNMLEDSLTKNEQSIVIEGYKYNRAILAAIQERLERYRVMFITQRQRLNVRQVRAKMAATVCGMVFLSVIAAGVWGSTLSVSSQHLSANNTQQAIAAPAQTQKSAANHYDQPAAAAPAQSQNSVASGAASQPASYRDIARQAAISQGIDPDRFVRQIQQESGFNPNAVSPVGATGIAQFMPATAASMGVDPNNPTQALYGAARMMSDLQKQFGGSAAMALAGYNAGPGAVQNAIQAGGSNWLANLPAETQNYVQVIL